MMQPEMTTEPPITEDTTSLSILYTVSRIFDIYLQPFIILFGVIGNIVSFRLNDLPSYRNTTTCVYMKGLAISDTIVLLH